LKNLSTITTPLGLHNIIGDHLISMSLSKSQELESQPICILIFKRLQEAHIIPGKEEPKQESSSSSEESTEDSNEGYKEDGCCLICEREMPLTKHHLIPREVHEWHKKHGGKTHKQLHTGIMICRDCHSAIHKFISNVDMGKEYYTLEKILEHEKVQGWIPYIRKQRCTNKADRRTWVQNVPRMPDSDSD